MTMSLKFDLTAVLGLEEPISASEMKNALREAGQIMINSTHAGYLKQRGPGGETWQANVPWYSEAKGAAATLTGPTSKRMYGSIYEGYEFAKINLKRMRNSLLARVEGAERVIINYDAAASERADITQSGGPSKLNIISPQGTTFEIDLELPPRPHLGVAENYFRMGSATDPDHVREVFGSMVDVKIF